jgi:tetratricopeptide (TPR) repeat protein
VTFVNRHPLSEFGEAALQSLPSGGGVVLTDFPERLAVFQAAQAKSCGKTSWLPVDTRLLPLPDYRKRLNQFCPGVWLLGTNRHTLAPTEMVQVLRNLTQNNRVFYLHPSFGYFFESFYLESCGTVAELKSYSPKAITPPALTTDNISLNERFWNDFTPRLDALQRTGDKTKNRALQNIEKNLHLEAVVSGQAQLLREWYAVALNCWGIALQRAGRLPEAERRFSQATALDPKNWTARANLFCNTNLQAGKALSLADVGNLASEFRTIQNISLFLGRYGPVDEPSFCFLLGNACVQANLPRQALINLERSAALAPLVPAPQLALANLYARFSLGDQSMQAISRVRELMKKSPDYPLVDLELSLLEAGVDASRTNTQHSMKVLQSLLDRYPGDTKVEGHVLKAYVSLGNLTNAELVASNLISRQPQEIGFQLTKSGILIRTGRAAEAIPLLNHILAITNSLPAKINRAIAYLQITNVAAAKADYLELQKAEADPFLVNFGLAEVALRESNTNLAVSYFTSSLSNTPSGSIQWQAIRKRLGALSP